MILEIDHHSGEPIYRQVVRQVRHQVLTGILVEGQQIETNRQLSTRLNINPMTLSKAFTILEAEGLIERRRGVGLFVRANNSPIHTKKANQELSKLVNSAIVMAIQLDIPEEKLLEIISQRYQEKLKNKKTK